MPKNKHVSDEAIRKAFEEIARALKPLNAEEKRRVVQAAVELHEIPITSSRTDEGDHECA